LAHCWLAACNNKAFLLSWLTYRIADGGRHAMQLLRGTAKAAVTGDSVHHFQRIFRPHFLPANFLNATAKY
jgi:hypothetical protein